VNLSASIPTDSVRLQVAITSRDIEAAIALALGSPIRCVRMWAAEWLRVKCNVIIKDPDHATPTAANDIL